MNVAAKELQGNPGMRARIVEAAREMKAARSRLKPMLNLLRILKLATLFSK